MNEETFTAFIEFTRRNCGAPFVKAFANGGIDVQVLDVPESEGSGTYGPYTVRDMIENCPLIFRKVSILSLVSADSISKIKMDLMVYLVRLFKLRKTIKH